MYEINLSDKEKESLQKLIQERERRSGLRESGGKVFRFLTQGWSTLLLFGLLLFLSGMLFGGNSGAEYTDYKDGQILSAGGLNQRFKKLHESINQLKKVTPPVGAIMAWHRDFAGKTPELPEGFVACDGQKLEDQDSIYNGENIPNLNGVRAGADSPGGISDFLGNGTGPRPGIFLRGGNFSGIGENDSFQGHYHNKRFDNPNATNLGAGVGTGAFAAGFGTGGLTSFNVTEPISDGGNGNPRYGQETKPKNMSVIWIMRVK